MLMTNVCALSQLSRSHIFYEEILKRKSGTIRGQKATMTWRFDSMNLLRRIPLQVGRRFMRTIVGWLHSIEEI